MKFFNFTTKLLVYILVLGLIFPLSLVSVTALQISYLIQLKNNSLYLGSVTYPDRGYSLIHSPTTMSIEALTWALKQPPKNSGAKYILILLANFANEKNLCYPSQEYLAEITGYSDRGIRNFISLLEDEKLITTIKNKKENGTFSNNVYRLNFDIPDRHIPEELSSYGPEEPSSYYTKESSYSSSSKTHNQTSAEDSASSVLSRSEKRKLNRARKTKYPVNFSPDEQSISGLLEKHPTITKTDIAKCFREFKEYHTEDDGQLKKHIDWQLTFRKWVTRSIEYGKIGKEKSNGISQRVVSSSKITGCKYCKKDGKDNCHIHKQGGQLDKMKTDPRYTRFNKVVSKGQL